MPELYNNARKILYDIIEDFSPDKFIRFFREKSRAFTPREEELFQYDDDNFRNGVNLGEIQFAQDEKMLVCAFEASQPLSERSGKKAQYEKGKKILKESQSEAGIFIFYDPRGNFRFSLIYANYLGTRRDWSAFRRFTYFVNPEFTNKTFLQRIGGEDNDDSFSSLEKIKDVFSVEKVTNKFFDDFRVIFERTKHEFEKQNKNTVCLWLKDRYTDEEYKEQINRFVYTFLGRIVFVYFLQRKGWIENQVNYIRKTLENNSNTSLYLSFFQPLFFDVFAKKESERPAEIKKQYKDTPYLNGGLFERSELENNLQEKGIFIFFDDKFIRDIILNFFENYNFTIDENSPDDQEVSIDPEMLGKVFENTLAEEERGKKGTFYTPREVVHFMVKDSLWQFLQNETKINKEKLHQLIYDKEEIEPLTLKKEEIRLLDDKLEHIKVLDPAVGSAAFPVEMMQVLVNLRKRLNVNVGKNINEVSLKKHFIKENLYGVDIDPGAIEIAKLRLWLALIVDYEKSEAEPLPNLDFQFRVGNSLQEKIDDIDIFQEEMVGQYGLFKSESEYEKMKDRMIAIKDKFYLSDNENEKKRLKKQFDNLEHELIQAVLKNYGNQFKSQIDNVDTLVKGQRKVKVQKEIEKTLKIIAKLEQKIKDGTYKLFKPDFHFSEVFDRKDNNNNKIGGFDIVIGNPPYGVKVENDIKEWHGLGSKDSYGIFISTALKRFLKPGGILSFIVSDTWLTIKTHKPLREQVLGKQLHKIIRVHQDCFEATVNACIMSVTNRSDNDSKLITADFTNISTRKEIEELREKLYHLDDFIGQSTSKLAVYEYNQGLIKTNSNLPIFVGSPKLFQFMSYPHGVSSLYPNFADVKKGIDTGENDYFLYQNPVARGNYRPVPQERILNEYEISLLTIDERLHGIDPQKHKGKYIIPYDKGGESDTDEGWLPNYFVPTDYFIDWSRVSVKELRSRTQRDSGKNKASIRNEDSWFKKGITFSLTGQYAPTVRLNSTALFDNNGSTIFPNEELKTHLLLGLLASKLMKYFFKNFIDHTVHAQVNDFKGLPIVISFNPAVDKLVRQIFVKQKQNPRYDYMSNEQKEIDKLVYEMYGLNAEDIREVETWYARRYPKLARFCEV
ncbi:MAG: DNA methyltransferase [Thermodesulfobacteriota bacterium]